MLNFKENIWYWIKGTALIAVFFVLGEAKSQTNSALNTEIVEYKYGYKIYLYSEKGKVLDSILVSQSNPNDRIKPVIKGDRVLYIGMRSVPGNFFYDFRSSTITPEGFESVDRCSAHIAAWAYETQTVDNVKMNRRRLKVRFFDETTKEFIKTSFKLHQGSFGEFCEFMDNMQ